jgi:hypothetical protein
VIKRIRYFLEKLRKALEANNPGTSAEAGSFPRLL